MKKLLLIPLILFSVYSFSQEKKLKMEIRTNNSANEIHRITNDHKFEVIDLRKERRDNSLPTYEKHRHPIEKKDIKKEDRKEHNKHNK